jgi:uncharacterized protein YjbJ (UPF0337 family)
MDKNTFKGNWDQLRGQVKKTWGKLTDNQLEKIEGDFDTFVGAVEKAYGYTRSEAASSVKEFLNKEDNYGVQTPVGAGIRKAAEKINEFSETVAAKSDRVVHQGEEAVSAAQKNAAKYIDFAMDYTKEHPVKVTLIAVGIGFLFGKFLSK